MYKRIMYIIIPLVLCIAFICILGDYKIIKNVQYAEEENSKVVIRISSNWNSYDTKSKAFQQIISDFNKNSEDTVIINDYIPGNDYISRLKADFASENEPDIFISWPNITTQQLFAANKIISFNDILLDDFSWYESFDKSIWKYVVYDGKSYGLPLEVSYAGFFVNNDVISKLGLTPPQTFNELLNQIPIFLDNGIIPIASDISENGMLLYKTIVASLAGRFNTENIYSQGTVNPYYIKAGEYMKQLYEMNAFPEELFSISEYEKNDLFINKKAAYIVQYSNFLSTACEKNNENIDNILIIPFPRFNESIAEYNSALYGVSQDTIFVSSKAWKNEQKREKILKILQHFTSVETAEYLVKNSGIIPSVKIRHASTYPSNSIYQKNYIFARTIAELIDFQNYYIDSDIFLDFTNNFPKFLAGQNTIEELWKNAYNQSNQ